MIYEFTESDLRSNKQGVISPGQKKWLDGIGNGILAGQWGSVKIGVPFLIFGSCLIVSMYAMTGNLKLIIADPVNIVVLCFSFLVIFFLLALSVFLTRRRVGRLFEPTLLQVEGAVELDEEYSRYGPTYFVYIDKKEFKFPEKVDEIFPDGKRYRVFCCETHALTLILSYEELK